MSDNSHRKKTAETLISITILILLAIIAVTILLKQADFDIGRFGLESTIAKSTSTGQLDLTSLAPDNFKSISKTKIYNSENLYEKINGKAPFYTESGFKKLYSQQFINTLDDTAIIDIYLYDMADMKNAFAVFSQQRRAESKQLAQFDLVFAYQTTNGAYFVKDRFYIEIVGSSDSQLLLDEIIKIADKIQARLDTDENIPMEELKFFPKDGLTAESFRFSRNDPFGFGVLSNTITAEYKIEGESIVAFLSAQSSAAQAREIAENYKKILLENEAVRVKEGNETLASCVFDLYGMFEIVLNHDKFVIGVHAAEDKNKAETIAMKLRDNIK